MWEDTPIAHLEVLSLNHKQQNESLKEVAKSVAQAVKEIKNKQERTLIDSPSNTDEKILVEQNTSATSNNKNLLIGVGSVLVMLCLFFVWWNFQSTTQKNEEVQTDRVVKSDADINTNGNTEVKTNPNDILAVWLDSAEVAFNAKNYVLANQYYNRVLKVQSLNKIAVEGAEKTQAKMRKQYHYVLKIAGKAYGQKQYETALKKYGEALQLNPDARSHIQIKIAAIEKQMQQTPKGMVLVSGGNFEMGCSSQEKTCLDNSKPAHSVTLNSFFMDKTVVTNQQYSDFLSSFENQLDIQDSWLNVGHNYSGIEWLDKETFSPKKGYENLPVVGVNWFGATAYAKWAGKRLPTEAEWEFAAKGGIFSKGYFFSGSNNIDEVGWYVENGGESLHSVASKKANELGLYDMSGSVWEWCSDWYGEKYYAESPSENPKGLQRGKGRVLRGGCQINPAVSCLTQIRNKYSPHFKGEWIGFRLAKDIED